MATGKYRFEILLLISLLFYNSCQYLPKIIKVELPKDYHGWCFIIPTNNITKTSVKKNSKYQVNEYGVVYLPTAEIDSSDLILKVFESGVDISDFKRYAATVNQVKSHEDVKTRYKYIKFYIPAKEQRSIPDNDRYWLDNGYEYREQAEKIFDSLLLNDKLSFP